MCVFLSFICLFLVFDLCLSLSLSLSLSLVSFTSYDSLCFASDDEISEIRFFSHLLFFHITDEYQLVNTIHWEIFYLQRSFYKTRGKNTTRRKILVQSGRDMFFCYHFDRYLSFKYVIESLRYLTQNRQRCSSPCSTNSLLIPEDFLCFSVVSSISSVRRRVYMYLYTSVFPGLFASI